MFSIQSWPNSWQTQWFYLSYNFEKRISQVKSLNSVPVTFRILIHYSYLQNNVYALISLSVWVTEKCPFF